MESWTSKSPTLKPSKPSPLKPAGTKSAKRIVSIGTQSFDYRIHAMWPWGCMNGLLFKPVHFLVLVLRFGATVEGKISSYFYWDCLNRIEHGLCRSGARFVTWPGSLARRMHPWFGFMSLSVVVQRGRIARYWAMRTKFDLFLPAGK
jgi:hypothetical protein